MYELQGINQEVVKKYYDSIFTAMKKENWHNVVCLSVESAFHNMLPNFPKYELEKYVKILLKPILNAKENNFKVRDFRDDDREDRLVYGSILANLAKDNPNNIYLFKVSAHHIWSLSYGYRADEIEFENIKSLYSIKVRETYKTKINNSYTIEFEEIN